MSTNNPYLELVQDDTINSVKTSMLSAVDKTPEVEARLQGLAKQYGMPVEAVRLDQPAVERRAKLDAVDYKTLAEQYPSTSRLLSDPAKAAISHDDVQNLTAIEDTIGPIRGPKPTFTTYATGLLKSLPLGAEMAFQGVRMQLDDLFGFQASRDDAQRKYARASLEMETLNPDFESKTAQGIYGGLTSTLRAVPGLAASIATRSTAPMLATIGLQTEAEAYGKYRNRGASAGEAFAGAAGEGAVEVGTELLPMGFLVKQFGRAGAGHFLTGLAAREIPSEQIATLVQDAIDTAVANPDKTWSQYLAERPEAAYQTLLATATQAGVMAAGHTAMVKVAGRVQDAHHALDTGAALTTAAELATESKVRERDAATAQQFFQSLTEDGQKSVWISPQVLAEAGIEEQAAARIPGVADQIAQANATNTDIEIAVSDLLTTTDSELVQAMIPHLATEPGGFTPTSAKAYVESGAAQELQQEVARVMEARKADEAFDASRKVVESGVLAQLQEVGRFSPAVNKAYSALVSNFYAVQASKLNVTPEWLAQAYPLNITAERLGGADLEQGQSLADVVKKWDDAGIDGSVWEKNGVITLSKIAVPEGARGAGKGTAAMKALVDYADSTGQHIVLSPSADFGGNKKRLVEFYKRFGFIENKGKNRAFSTSESMYRQAEGKVLYQNKAANEGPFGPVFNQFKGDAQGAVAHLMEQKNGEAIGALSHPEIGDIDLVWGKEGDASRSYAGGYGLAKIVAKHPEVLNDLQNIVSSMRVATRSENRVRLESQDHEGAVRLQWDGEAKHWLMTAYEKRKGGSSAEPRTDTPDVKKDDSPSAASDESIEQDLKKFYQSGGARGAYSPESNTISLLQHADLSTFLHETGHFFLDIMAEMAAKEDAPLEIKGDMEAVMKWFGVDSLAAWGDLDMEQQRPFHEQFARGFEAYLMEGKAPNTELQGLFSRFRSWLVNIYKSLTALDVELSTEVRGVFDRMLASTAAIRDAEQDAGMAGMFESKPPFMTDEEWAAYRALSTEATQEAAHQLETRSIRDMQWLSNAKAKMLSQMQREAKGKREAIRAEVEAEVMAEPINQARQRITQGGEKLSRPILREMYGDGPDALWRKLPKNMIAENGIAPDQVAELFPSFESGDQLVRELLSAEDPAEKIAGITDQRMLEQHGELTDPQSIDRAVNEALHSRAHARFIATEMNALHKAVGNRTVLATAAQTYAEAAIARSQIGTLRPDLFTAAAKRAAKAADEAFKKGDIAQAAVEKQTQLINTYAAKAAFEARDEAKKTLNRFGKIANGKDDAVGKSRDMDMVHATRAILAEFGIGRKGAAAVEYMEKVKAYDPGMAAVLGERIAAATANATEFGNLTVEQMRGLRDEIESLWYLAKRSRQMEVDGDLLDREEVQDQLRARLDEIGVPATVPGDSHAITPRESMLAGIQSAKAALTRVEAWASVKDGNTPMGPFRKFIWSTIKDPADAYRMDKAKYLKQFRALLDPIAPTLTQMKIAAPELGYTFGYDKGGMGKVELLHAILHTGNEGNKKKLLLGRKWATELADGSLDTSKWDAFITRMIGEGKLTKADFDFAQGVWDLLESIKPLAQKAHRDVFGRYFDEVTATPFTTPFGTYAGGYVPAIADSRIVSDAKTRALIEEETSNLVNVMPSTSKGFTKGRVEYNRPLLLDLRLIPQHIDKVLLFSHLEQPIRDVRRVLASGTVATPLNKIDPAAFDGLLTPWLNRTARQQVETQVSGSNGMMRLFSVVRQRAGMAAMFANISNTAQQITGFSIAALRVKPKYLLSAAVDFIRSPKQLAETVAAASPYMANRMENEVGAMQDAINQILLNPKAYDKAVAWTTQHTYFLQSAVDNVMGPIIWHGAYNEAIENAPAGMSDSQLATYARRLADSAVRETQGSTLPEDISRIETGNAFVRIFTQFYGYFNMQANIIGTELAKVSQDMGLRRGAGRGLYVLLMGLLVPSWAATAIALAFRGGPDDENKDGEYLDDWLAQIFGWGTLRSGTALVPVAGQVANSLANTFNSKPYDDKLSTGAAVSMIESAVSAPSSVYKAIAEDGSQAKAIRDVATLVSMTLGVPASALAKPLVYATDVQSGRVEPTGPVDAARGVITGVASAESKH